jgi:hypothetical protein
MAESRLVELEYQSLRQELFLLIDIGQSAVKFCVPASAAVYAVPVLLHQMDQVYLWSVCAGLAGLLITALVHTFCGCVEGARKIGAYIMEGIEPRSGGQLNWEHVLFHLEEHQGKPSLTPILAIAGGALLANIAAAGGAGVMFLKATESWIPPAIAAIFALPSLPAAWRVSRNSTQREHYVAEVREIIRRERKSGPSSVPKPLRGKRIHLRPPSTPPPAE